MVSPLWLNWRWLIKLWKAYYTAETTKKVGRKRLGSRQDWKKKNKLLYQLFYWYLLPFYELHKIIIPFFVNWINWTGGMRAMRSQMVSIRVYIIHHCCILNEIRLALTGEYLICLLWGRTQMHISKSSQIYFHWGMMPETNLRISDSLHFLLTTHSFMSHFPSVPHGRLKLTLGHLNHAV